MGVRERGLAPMWCTLLCGIISCAPLDDSVDAGPDSGDGGLSLGCPVTVGTDHAVSPRSFDPEYGLAPMDESDCVDGAEPHPGLVCADIEGPCACRWTCEPTCGVEQVCTEERNCECHPSYRDGVDGCEWRGLHDNGDFETCDGWRFYVAPGNEGTAALADVADGRLHMALNGACTTAIVDGRARIPARAEMPGGAALVVVYSLDSGTATIRLNGSQSTLSVSETGRVHRVCVRLDDYPRIAEVAFTLENLGACFPDPPVGERHLWVDEVRLEPDSEC